MNKTIVQTQVAASHQRESVDEALLIVESYGPWSIHVNDGIRREIVLAEEVHRLRSLLADQPYIAVVTNNNMPGERHHIVVSVEDRPSLDVGMKLYAALAQSAPPAPEPPMTLDQFFKEAARIGLTVDVFAKQLAERPEFADCLPAGAPEPSRQSVGWPSDDGLFHDSVHIDAGPRRPAKVVQATPAPSREPPPMEPIADVRSGSGEEPALPKLRLKYELVNSRGESVGVMVDEAGDYFAMPSAEQGEAP